MKNFLQKIFVQFKKSKALVIATILCLLAIFLMGCFSAYAISYSKILPNIMVEGVNIGGMTTEDAEKELNLHFGAVSKDRNLIVECDGVQKEIGFNDIDLSVDSGTTAENAFKRGREGGTFKKIISILKSAFLTEEIPLQIKIDESVTKALIDELTDGKEDPPAPAEYKIGDNEITIIRGHGGRMVDRQKAIEMLKRAAVTPTTERIRFQIEVFEEETVDVDKLYADITAPIKNAEYKFEDGEVKIIPEKSGAKVDKNLIKQAIDSGQQEYIIKAETQTPEITAEKLEEMLFRDVLGSFTTDFSTSTAARASNVTLTANRINGTILMPGDVFSYDNTIGRRTVANGYREAGVYIGNKVESGIGGGICQTSSTLYSAALYANLEIVSRTSHSLPVSYVPAGQDATIAEGYIDLKIKNSTEYPIKIVASVSGRKITCSIMGVKDPETKVELVHTITANYEPQTERTSNPDIPKGYKHIVNKGAKGYAVASQRIVKKSGKVVKTENLTRSVYRAAPIEEEVNPEDMNTPTEELKNYVPGMVIPQEPLPDENTETAENHETSGDDETSDKTISEPTEEPETQEEVLQEELSQD